MRLVSEFREATKNENNNVLTQFFHWPNCVKVFSTRAKIPFHQHSSRFSPSNFDQSCPKLHSTSPPALDFDDTIKTSTSTRNPQTNFSCSNTRRSSPFPWLRPDHFRQKKQPETMPSTLHGSEDRPHSNSNLQRDATRVRATTRNASLRRRWRADSRKKS